LDPVLLDPTKNPAKAKKASLAPRRLKSLDGKTLGLLNNTKVKADYILDAVEDLLSQRYGLKEVVRITKETFSRPMSDRIATELAAKCDAVVTAVGS
jgi:hypothetical protein